jgi:hypothetical protein
LNACAYYAFSSWEGVGSNSFVYSGIGHAYIRWVSWFARQSADWLVSQLIGQWVSLLTSESADWLSGKSADWLH